MKRIIPIVLVLCMLSCIPVFADDHNIIRLENFDRNVAVKDNDRVTFKAIDQFATADLYVASEDAMMLVGLKLNIPDGVVFEAYSESSQTWENVMNGGIIGGYGFSLAPNVEAHYPVRIKVTNAGTFDIGVDLVEWFNQDAPLERISLKLVAADVGQGLPSPRMLNPNNDTDPDYVISIDGDLTANEDRPFDANVRIQGDETTTHEGSARLEVYTDPQTSFRITQRNGDSASITSQMVGETLPRYTFPITLTAGQDETYQFTLEFDEPGEHNLLFRLIDEDTGDVLSEYRKTVTISERMDYSVSIENELKAKEKEAFDTQVRVKADQELSAIPEKTILEFSVEPKTMFSMEAKTTGNLEDQESEIPPLTPDGNGEAESEPEEGVMPAAAAETHTFPVAITAGHDEVLSFTTMFEKAGTYTLTVRMIDEATGNVLAEHQRTVVITTESVNNPHTDVDGTRTITDLAAIILSWGALAFFCLPRKRRKTDAR